MSKTEELDIGMIKDETVDAMLKMQLMKIKPIDDKRNYKIEEKGLARKTTLCHGSRKRLDDLTGNDKRPFAKLPTN